MVLSSYAAATHCPVLRWRMVLQILLRMYEVASAIALRRCYAMSGTEIAVGATSAQRYPSPALTWDTDGRCTAVKPRFHSTSVSGYAICCTDIALCDVTFGTGIAYGATRCAVLSEHIPVLGWRMHGTAWHMVLLDMGYTMSGTWITYHCTELAYGATRCAATRSAVLG
eukprot:3435600-Rhodomonas_salina.7